jgi:urease accessory protein
MSFPDTQNMPASLSARSLIQLMWLASPALPIGGFSYSEGLEAGVEWAGLAAETIASDWLHDQLHLTLARADLAVLAQAIPAWRVHRSESPNSDLSRIRQLNAWTLQSRETSETRAQAEQMGRSLLAWLRNHDGTDAVQLDACSAIQPTYPLAFALAASLTDASVGDCLIAYAFGWAENMTQAAVKAVPLGQSAGQRILARLGHAIPDAVESAMQLADDRRQAFSPMLAILSSQHETQYSRLFRS